MFSSLKYVDNGAMIMPYLEQLSNILTKKVISFGVGSVLFSLPLYGGFIKPIVALKLSNSDCAFGFLIES